MGKQLSLFDQIEAAPAMPSFRLWINGYDMTKRMPMTAAILEQQLIDRKPPPPRTFFCCGREKRVDQ